MIPTFGLCHFDLEASRRVLQSKGWSDTDGDGILDKEGEPFSFELITNTGSQVRIDAAVMVQEHLRRAGIEARVRQLEFNTVVSRALEHDFDAMLGGWDIDTSLDLTYAFHSQSIDDGYNFGQFSNADVDRLIDATNQAMNPAERMLLLREIESILHHAQPLYFPLGTAATCRCLEPFARLQPRARSVPTSDSGSGGSPRRTDLEPIPP